MNKLHGKIILITGANGEIALAFAKKALSEGAKAVILSGINETLGKQNADVLGDNCYYHHLDARNPDDWKKIIIYIQEEFEHLDVLINNASITGTELNPPMLGLENSPISSWKEVMSNDLDSIFIGCQEALKLMKNAKEASIVNIGSRSSLNARPNRMAYAAAKAGVISLSKSIAIYCLEKGYNIRCNVVLPSTIMTEMWDPILMDNGSFNEEKFKKISSKIPLKRFGKPEEVAKAILFLASDDSSYITGSELLVDGGAQALDSLRS